MILSTNFLALESELRMALLYSVFRIEVCKVLAMGLLPYIRHTGKNWLVVWAIHTYSYNYIHSTSLYGRVLATSLGKVKSRRGLILQATTTNLLVVPLGCSHHILPRVATYFRT